VPSPFRNPPFPKPARILPQTSPVCRRQAEVRSKPVWTISPTGIVAGTDGVFLTIRAPETR